MTDSPRSADPEEGPEPASKDESTHVTLPDFTPVPRLKDRSNGWKPEVQRAFIEALAETGSVKAACRRVGRTDNGAYQLRRHPEGEGFRAAWDAALDLGIRVLEDALTERAIHGVEVPVYSYGNLIGSRTVYNDRLGMFMLRNRAPHRFAAGGGPKGLNAVGQMEMNRLKKRLRAEWEAEQRAREEEEDQKVCESIDRFLGTMRNNRLANMSPAQRERQIAADAQERADKAAGWSTGEPYREYAEQAAALLPRFIAEVEAEWPPLEPWAWDEPEEGEDEEEADADACPERSRGARPEPGRREFPALPPPAAEKAEPEEDAGPRVRSLKDEEW